MIKRLLFVCFLILGLSLALLPVAQAQDDIPLVVVLSYDGPVTPAMVEYISRGIRLAEERSAELIIFQLNTPGGSTDLMTRVIQRIRASRVPLVVYVTPRGAMAASAGTLITLAGHLSAMAPETTIGAASPVGGEGEDLGETMEAKIKNDMKALARTLAGQRGKAAIELAEATIENAEAATAKEALQAGLVDFIAQDITDLLYQLNGATVETRLGSVTLHTENANLIRLNLSFIEQILQMLTNPNIVFLLLTIGVQAVLIELSSPGGWVAGFIGLVSLLLATYGLGILPVNYFGIIFLVMAFILFILDIKAPTHGALTVAGAACLIVGALVLFNSPSVPSFQRVSVPLVIGTSLTSSLIFVVILSFAIRAQKAPIRTGQESLVGKVGIARTPLSPSGAVQMGGELWSAELEAGEGPIPPGSWVKVTRVHGIHIYVRRTNR